MECTLKTRTLRLREPLRAAWGELRERTIVEVTLRDHDGAVGRGEAAPLEPYDGVPLAAVTAALDVYAAILEDAGMNAGAADLLELCAGERALPQALAALDMALWDMAGQREGRPVAALVRSALSEHAGSPLAAVTVNALVPATDRAAAAREAAAAAADGFGTVKVKVGAGDDAGRLAAVRAAVGRDVRIRADANGAWGDADEALANLRALEPLALELCEEPVHGVEALAAVRRGSPVPIAMDETDEPGAGATDAVCLKVARGGITAVVRDAAAARAAGSSVYLASTYDGPIGIAAALHAAAALVPEHASGLATLAAFDEDDHGLRAVGGVIAVPAGPGLLG